MRLSIRAALVTIFVTALLLSGDPLLADDGNDTAVRRLVVLSIDSNVLMDETGSDLTKSLIALLSDFRQGDDFYLSVMSKPGSYIGPYRFGQLDFSEYEPSLKELVADVGPNRPVELATAIAETYELMGVENAPQGSMLYLVGPSEISTENNYVSRFLDPLSEMFASNKWMISGLTLPDSSQDVITAMDRISSITGAHSIELTATGGLKKLADRIMSDDSLGTLMLSSDEVLSENGTLTTTLEVAPGTKELKLVFFKEDPFGSLRLNNPNGIEASLGDRTSSSVTDTPYMVIWELKDPVPGNWTVDVRGMEGSLSSWHISKNKFRLKLITDGSIPVSKSANIVAYVTDGDNMTSPGEGAYLSATITSPNGTEIVHQLNDLGKEGDATAGDNFYSITIPSLETEGQYAVTLELGWAGQPNTITESTNFKAQYFPSIDLTPLNVDQIYPGQRVTVANILINIAGQPYAVVPSSITPRIGGDSADLGEFELVPRNMTPDGRAWMYDVLFAPTSDGLTSLVLNLDMEYAGRLHNHITGSLLLTSINIPQPTPSDYSPSQSETPVISPVPESKNTRGLPIGLIGIPIAIIALVMAAVLYQRSLTRPFGKINNEYGEPLLDFATIKRSKIRSLVLPSSVSGSETGIEELRGITFKFKGDEVEIRSLGVSPTVRVDNRPIVGELTLSDKSWIGIQGRLFNFLLNRNEPTLAESSYGDD